MKRLSVIVLFFAFVFVSCTNKKTVAHARDYNVFLNSSFIEKKRTLNAEEINFWENKLAADTGSFGAKLELAFHILHRFKLNGRVGDVLTADSLFKSSAAKLNYTSPEIFYSLSQNAITQHRFKDAWHYNQQADEKGGAKYTTNLIGFDAGMELGLYADAARRLEQIKDKEGLDYLIRKAKFEDHKGNLNGAITLMEKALDKVKDLNKKSSFIWIKSNLADMYGHAGRIKEAYQSYLDVLKTDSADLYCLKGIAWIAFSHDKNTAEAKRILQYILSQTQMPDLHLVLAQIAAFENNEGEKNKQLQLFLDEVKKPAYGAMYNKYLISLYTEDLADYDEAVKIAEAETNSRPTPETFDWLAWVLYKRGDVQKAGELIRKFVLNKTFEPDAVIRSAYILAANNETKKAKSLLQQCLSESSFEIGPVKTKEIEGKIREL